MNQKSYGGLHCFSPGGGQLALLKARPPGRSYGISGGSSLDLYVFHNNPGGDIHSAGEASIPVDEHILNQMDKIHAQLFREKELGGEDTETRIGMPGPRCSWILRHQGEERSESQRIPGTTVNSAACRLVAVGVNLWVELMIWLMVVFSTRLREGRSFLVQRATSFTATLGDICCLTDHRSLLC